jgi:hypothetical protein
VLLLDTCDLDLDFVISSVARDVQFRFHPEESWISC